MFCDLHEIDYLLVKIKSSTSDLFNFPIISTIEIDSKEIFIFNGEEYKLTDKFENFCMGIVLDDNKFLKSETGLYMNMKKYNKQKYLVSTSIYKKKKFKNNIEFLDRFKLISLNNCILYPYYVPCNIINIDINKKFIDLSISEYYSLKKE